MLNIKQRQANLQFLGFYFGQIDNIEGIKTKQAYKDFQKNYGLVVDGIYGINTDTKLIEVIKDIQGKIGTAVDGIVGTNTIAKCKEYQLKNGLTVDGVCGVNTRAKLNSIITNLTWDDIKYFKKSEFDCKCGCGLNNIDLKLVNILDEIREYFGKPCIITSGCRCQKYNDSLKGSIKNSKHVQGKACDIWISGVSKTALLAKCREYVANGRATYTYTNSTNMARAVHIDIA